MFVDVDKDTMRPSPDALEAFLTAHAVRKDSGAYNRHTHRRIAAILPMHTFGHPCRIEEIVAIAKAWSIPVVEDAAEAIGSWSKQTHCGLFGDLGILSFNGNKTITCTDCQNHLVNVNHDYCKQLIRGVGSRIILTGISSLF